MTLTTDFALATYREDWLHHNAIGDPSWDTFVRESHNPIYTGRDPYQWPVNGFLFRDPPTGQWFAYVGLYPRGYWPAGPCLVMRERLEGGWDELGLAIQGDPAAFDGDGHHPGAMPDVSVVYHDGRYHMVYDWANYSNNRGGLGYACADRPEGPFTRATHPLHLDIEQKPIIGKYVRAYAATLIKRESDWMILHSMSTPGNAGGTWAMACMLAASPEGPYSAPELLLFPQSNDYLPALMEYYPAFVHAGFVYAPATSVAKNRTFQCVFRAPIEEAHLAKAWGIAQHGSVWHAEDLPAESKGIWGQTFSGQVSPDNQFRVYFNSKTKDDVGTVHIAHRQWNQPYKDGFTLSAPNAQSFAILRRHYRTFTLATKAATNGSWSISWGCRSPLGPSSTTADTTPNVLMEPQAISWKRIGERWFLDSLDDDGVQERQSGLCPKSADGFDSVDISQDEFSVSITLNGQVVCMLAYSASEGRIQLIADAGCNLQVAAFEVTGESHPYSEDWLAIDALAGSAIILDEKEWCEESNATYRYGIGYRSVNATASAKWNIHGCGYRLHTPRGPGFGRMQVFVDGQVAGTVDLNTDEFVKSAVVLAGTLEPGYHAIKAVALDKGVRLDTLQVIV